MDLLVPRVLARQQLTPVAPAVINAITDAIDCEFFDMPVTPEKLKQLWLSKLKSKLF